MSTPMPASFRPGSGPSTVEVGDRLDGRYLLLETVGRGGSGSVWRAHDELLGRDVAVKRLHVGRHDDPERALAVRDRARREGRVAARLHHPRLASIFDMTTLHGEVCLVMEFVRAPSLADLLDREGRMHPRRVARIGAQIAEGLAAMHARGIVHRDIKPANVMIGDEDVVTVTDFGIAVVDADPSTSDHLVAGTPQFMAPEIALGGTATDAADVFSLGATLYTALEGVSPIGDGGNVLEVLARAASGTVRPAAHPGALTDLLTALLDRDPDRRPTAGAVAETLGAALPATVPDAAADVGVAVAVPSPGRWPSRRRLALAAGVVGAAGVLGVLVALPLSGSAPATGPPARASAPPPAPGPVLAPSAVVAPVPAEEAAVASTTSSGVAPAAGRTTTASPAVPRASATGATPRSSARASAGTARERGGDPPARGRDRTPPGQAKPAKR